MGKHDIMCFMLCEALRSNAFHVVHEVARYVFHVVYEVLRCNMFHA